MDTKLDDSAQLSRTSTSNATAPSPALASIATAEPPDVETPPEESQASDPLPGQRSRPVRRIQLDLSPSQVAGGSLAAATAAALSSTLGVAGTIVGAAVFSLITAVVGALYTQSLRRTRTRMAAAADVARRRTGSGGVAPSGPGKATAPAGSVPEPPADRHGATDPEPSADEPEPEPGTEDLGSSRPGTAALVPPARIALRPSRLIAGVLVIFAVAVAGVTGLELITGHPLSGGASGTTVGELTRSVIGTGSTDPAQVPPAENPVPGPERPPGNAEQPEPSDPAPTDQSPRPSTPTDPTPTQPTPTPPGTTPPTPPAPVPSNGF